MQGMLSQEAVPVSAVLMMKPGGIHWLPANPHYITDPQCLQLLTCTVSYLSIVIGVDIYVWITDTSLGTETIMYGHCLVETLRLYTRRIFVGILMRMLNSGRRSLKAILTPQTKILVRCDWFQGSWNSYGSGWLLWRRMHSPATAPVPLRFARAYSRDPRIDGDIAFRPEVVRASV